LEEYKHNVNSYIASIHVQAEEYELKAKRDYKQYQDLKGKAEELEFTLNKAINTQLTNNPGGYNK